MHQTDYDAAWADLKWRIRMFWIVVLTYLPGVALITWLGSLIWPSHREQVGLVVAILWMIAFAATGFYRSFFRCPRCGKLFFQTDFWINTIAGRCMHCGLRRWSKPETA